MTGIEIDFLYNPSSPGSPPAEALGCAVPDNLYSLPLDFYLPSDKQPLLDRKRKFQSLFSNFWLPK